MNPFVLTCPAASGGRAHLRSMLPVVHDRTSVSQARLAALRDEPASEEYAALAQALNAAETEGAPSALYSTVATFTKALVNPLAFAAGVATLDLVAGARPAEAALSQPSFANWSALVSTARAHSMYAVPSLVPGLVVHYPCTRMDSAFPAGGTFRKIPAYQDAQDCTSAWDTCSAKLMRKTVEVYNSPVVASHLSADHSGDRIKAHWEADKAQEGAEGCGSEDGDVGHGNDTAAAVVLSPDDMFDRFWDADRDGSLSRSEVVSLKTFLLRTRGFHFEYTDYLLSGFRGDEWDVPERMFVTKAQHRAFWVLHFPLVADRSFVLLADFYPSFHEEQVLRRLWPEGTAGMWRGDTVPAADKETEDRLYKHFLSNTLDVASSRERELSQLAMPVSSLLAVEAADTADSPWVAGVGCYLYGWRLSAVTFVFVAGLIGQFALSDFLCALCMQQMGGGFVDFVLGRLPDRLRWNWVQGLAFFLSRPGAHGYSGAVLTLLMLALWAFRGNRLESIVTWLEFEADAVLGGEFPRSVSMRSTVATLRGYGDAAVSRWLAFADACSGVATGAAPAAPAAAPATAPTVRVDAAVRYVKCPLCRALGPRSGAILGVRGVGDSQGEVCCVCLDAKSTVALPCGHVCLCQACFDKL